MMTIEIQRDKDRKDSYKCYKIKCSCLATETRFQARHVLHPKTPSSDDLE